MHIIAKAVRSQFYWTVDINAASFNYFRSWLIDTNNRYNRLIESVTKYVKTLKSSFLGLAFPLPNLLIVLHVVLFCYCCMLDVGNNLSGYNVAFSMNISRFYFPHWQCLNCQWSACCDDAVSSNRLITLIIDYCITLYFSCISISWFWNVEILLHFNFAFSQYSTSIYQSFDGQMNFRGYLILRLFPTRKIRENLMHAKIICFTDSTRYSILIIW